MKMDTSLQFYPSPAHRLAIMTGQAGSAAAWLARAGNNGKDPAEESPRKEAPPAEPPAELVGKKPVTDTGPDAGRPKADQPGPETGTGPKPDETIELTPEEEAKISRFMGMALIAVAAALVGGGLVFWYVSGELEAGKAETREELFSRIAEYSDRTKAARDALDTRATRGSAEALHEDADRFNAQMMQLAAEQDRLIGELRVQLAEIEDRLGETDRVAVTTAQQIIDELKTRGIDINPPTADELAAAERREELRQTLDQIEQRRRNIEQRLGIRLGNGHAPQRFGM